MAQASKFSKALPTWFVRTRNATDALVDGSIIILLALGHTESSVLMLLLRIGYSYLKKAIGAFLGEEKEAVNEAV